MATNAFTMMMGAARKKSQPALPLEVDVAPVVKKRLGRPPAIKKVLDLTPLVHDLTRSGTKVCRRGYISGDAQIRMTSALQVILKAKGKNCKRTLLSCYLIEFIRFRLKDEKTENI